MRIDRDHIFSERVQWESTVPTRAIRETPSLIIPQYRDVHDQKHENVPHVPLIARHTAIRALQLYREGSTTLQSLDNIMVAIEKGANNPKAHLIEQHLAELAIWALDLQRPYIAQSPAQPRAKVIDLFTRDVI